MDMFSFINDNLVGKTAKKESNFLPVRKCPLTKKMCDFKLSLHVHFASGDSGK